MHKRADKAALAIHAQIASRPDGRGTYITSENGIFSGQFVEQPGYVLRVQAGIAGLASSQFGKVLVVGYDNIGAIKPMLADGRVLATADQFAAKQAVFGIETALKALSAKQPQSSMPAEVKTDVVLVTKTTK